MNLTDPELFAEAFVLVCEHGRVSLSFLQRNLGIGYHKAAVLLEMLECYGLISEPGVDSKRTVLNRTIE